MGGVFSVRPLANAAGRVLLQSPRALMMAAAVGAGLAGAAASARAEAAKTLPKEPLTVDASRIKQGPIYPGYVFSMEVACGKPFQLERNVPVTVQPTGESIKVDRYRCPGKPADDVFIKYN